MEFFEFFIVIVVFSLLVVHRSCGFLNYAGKGGDHASYFFSNKSPIKFKNMWVCMLYTLLYMIHMKEPAHERGFICDLCYGRPCEPSRWHAYST
jgi:hypothetical protein